MGGSGTPPPWRYVTVSGLLVVLGVLWYAWWIVTGIGPAAVGYTLMPAGLVTAAAALRSMRRSVGLAPVAERFWGWLEAACYPLAAGYALLAVAAFRESPQLPAMPPVSAVLVGGGVLAAMWAVARVPVGVNSRADRGRQGLDRLIAFLGCVTVLWHFGIAPMLDAPQPWSGPAVATLMLSFGFAAGAITKVSYITGGPVDRAAVRLIGSTGLVAAAVAVFAAVPAFDGVIPAQAICLPVMPLLVALAARRQHGSAGARPRRGNVWLPYLAVLAVDLPLIELVVSPVAWDLREGETRLVVALAVVVTGLVTVRQYLSFRENSLLLAEKRASEARLRHEATHDPLTGLANRVLFRELLDEALAGPGATVLMIDMDDFKSVNDSLGHDAGDQLLIAFAEVLRSASGTDGTPARLAGDEFAILIDRPARGGDVAERLKQATTVPIGPHRLLVHVSAGLATAPGGAAATLLLRDADAAMYVAKQRGKANWVRYESGMEQSAQAHVQLGGDLREALAGGQLRVVYQPVVRLDDRRIVGVEALVRWEHPVQGTISPAEFIPAAEQTGLIVPVGRFVLRETCRQAAAWLAEFGPDALTRVAPNVSLRQLHDPDFEADVRAALEDHALPADLLVLELTESASLRSPRVSRVLHRLHGTGVRLALDDFGTGESSLSLLRTFPADIVKLDESFVDGIERDEPGSTAVARAVFQLAGAFGLETIAEGVENEEQAERLLRLGYTLGQGHHLGRPMTGDEITTIVAAQRAGAAAA
ncbi:putative bifunctional diguanylate cyclase/phosphodiesterase [Actinoplanes rectilineatus]|uniref:putative bifunctional diguanylate cyclase/phosphodiesterase n=1 Tax=Actinoplanes rectilineatus TaxID=113571 RepID=UPI0005F2AED1|nr:bifunctional diguanylate cyclase/phosphodiesterase [Actinoplanes rectilineatus]